jgi:hypothetical protein
MWLAASLVCAGSGKKQQKNYFELFGISWATCPIVCQFFREGKWKEEIVVVTVTQKFKILCSQVIIYDCITVDCLIPQSCGLGGKGGKKISVQFRLFSSFATPCRVNPINQLRFFFNKIFFRNHEK